MSSSSIQVKQEVQAPQFTCPTCLGDFSADSKQLVQVSQDLGCRHSVCIACYEQLDREHPKCPVCRLEIVLPPRPGPPKGGVDNPSPRMISAAAFLGLRGQNGSASPLNVAVIRPDRVSLREVVSPSMAEELRQVFTGPPFNQPDPGLAFFMLPVRNNVFADLLTPCAEPPFRVRQGVLHTQSVTSERLRGRKTVICRPGPDGKLVPCPDQVDSKRLAAGLHGMLEEGEQALVKMEEVCRAAEVLSQAAAHTQSLEQTGSTLHMSIQAKNHYDERVRGRTMLTAHHEAKSVFCQFDEKTDQWVPVESTRPFLDYASTDDYKSHMAFQPLAMELKALDEVGRLLREHMNFLTPRADGFNRISCETIRAFLGDWEDFPPSPIRTDDLKTKLTNPCHAYLQLLHHQSHGGNGPLLRARAPVPPALKALLDPKKRKPGDDDNDNSIKRECLPSLDD